MIRDQLERIREFLSTEHRLIGVSLLRVGLGIITLSLYSQHLAQFQFLWGNNGVVPYPLFQSILAVNQEQSLYAISASANVLLFALGIVATMFFTLGLCSRMASIAFYAFTFSLYTRNPFLLDGGDNLLYLLAFYLMFTDCGAHFSIDGRWRKERPAPFRALLHNFGVLAIVTQLTLLYFTSSFYKIQGHMWQDGTALYYILRSAEFNLTPLESYVYANGDLLTLLTWGTMILQMAWVFLIWHPKMRFVMVALTVWMHIGIAYFMGLFWFSAVMICAELVILSDSDYVRIVQACELGWSRGWRAIVSLRTRKLRPDLEVGEPAAARGAAIREVL